MGTFGMVLLMILGVILILTALVLFCPFLVLFSVSDEELILKIKVLGISLRIPLGQKEDSEDEDRQATATRTAKDEKDSALKKFLEMRNTF